MSVLEKPAKKASLPLGKCLALVVAIVLFSTAVILVFSLGRSWYKREQLLEVGAKLLYMPTRPIGSAQQYGVELQGQQVDDATLEKVVRLFQKGTPNHQTLILTDTSVSGEGLRYLAQLHTLDSLIITESDIGDSGITNVSKIRSLKSLTLEGMSVTSEHLQRLQNLPELESLALTIDAEGAARFSSLAKFDGRRPGRLYLTVTDPGLAIVQHLPYIDQIYITGHQITDQGMSHLDGARNIAALIANDCSISDNGLDHLSQSRRLQYLDLSGTGITDKAILRLRNFSMLRHLNLSDTAITDAGLQSLASSTSLRKLWLNSTHVSPQAVNKLKQEMPDIAIFW